jgi:hypothetical protein
MKELQEILWWEEAEKAPKEQVGNWTFIKDRMVLKNVETGYTLRLKDLTTPSMVLDELFRAIQKEEAKPGYDHDGLLRLLADVIQHHFDNYARYVFCKDGEPMQVNWVRKTYRRPLGG